MTEIYSILKRLLPKNVRNFIRDSDQAYQERLHEIDLKNSQIAELESSQQGLLKKLDAKTSLLEQQTKAAHMLAEISLLSDEDYDQFSQAGLFIVG